VFVPIGPSEGQFTDMWLDNRISSALGHVLRILSCHFSPKLVEGGGQ